MDTDSKEPNNNKPPEQLPPISKKIKIETALRKHIAALEKEIRLLKKKKPALIIIDDFTNEWYEF